MFPGLRRVAKVGDHPALGAGSSALSLLTYNCCPTIPARSLLSDRRLNFVFCLDDMAIKHLKAS